jgi:subtilisin family serine protease
VINDVTGADEALNGATNSAIVELDGGWSATSSCGASEFTVLLRGSGDASLWITAEKDALEGMFFEQAMRPGTINVPATGPGLLAAGCTVNRITWSPLDGPPVTLSSLGDDPNPVGDSACYFSSSGPTPFGVQKPEIAAPGGFVAAAMAAAADPRKFPGGLFDLGGCPPQNPFCAVVDEYHAIATGTSMSTPHVAGAVALLMNVDPSLTQARATAALQAGARFTSGHVPDLNQLGPGSLDVEGARVALLDMMSAPVAASPSRSWYSLSSAYARPDPTWPVWGAIELRTAGGDVAAGIDGSKLALSVSGGGVVLQRITQVRQGLFRFALAGRPVDLGNEITIDVSYAGTSLGKRTLPVGWDNWSASDPEVTAVGACGVARAGAGADVRGEIAVAGLAIVALRRRRRRPRQGAPK